MVKDDEEPLTSIKKDPNENAVSENKKKNDGSLKEVPLMEKKFFDPMSQGVRWTEKYSDSIEWFWNNIPDKIATFIATLAIFTFGATIKGL